MTWTHIRPGQEKQRRARDAVTFAALLVGSELVARVTGALEAAQSVYTPLFTSAIVWLGTLILLWKTRTSVHIAHTRARRRKVKGERVRTFEEVSGKAGLVDRAV